MYLSSGRWPCYKCINITFFLEISYFSGLSFGKWEVGHISSRGFKVFSFIPCPEKKCVGDKCSYERCIASLQCTSSNINGDWERKNKLWKVNYASQRARKNVDKTAVYTQFSWLLISFVLRPSYRQTQHYCARGTNRAFMDTMPCYSEETLILSLRLFHFSSLTDNR